MNAKDTLDVLLHFPIEESILLMGNHGIGKSQIVKQAARTLDVPCIDFRLSQNDVGDLKGMPFHVGGRTVFAPPEFMPITVEDAKSLKELLGLTEEINLGRYGDKGILFLDEINRASREVQQAAFELVLDRRMNLRPLPAGWRVVSAINDEDDVYSVNSMDPAFLSRFFAVKFEPSQEEWFKWANENGLHNAIVEFLRRHPDYLDPTKQVLEDAISKGVKKVHDRRAWHKFSTTLLELESQAEKGTRDYNPLDKTAKALNFLTLIADGYVGHMASVQFRRFIETDYKALDGNIIINKWTDAVKDQLVAIVKAGRIPELSSYNESVLAWIEKNVKGKLSDKQKKNLSNYVVLLPAEIVSDFWQKFNQESKDISDDWYMGDKIARTTIVNALVNPSAKKKGAAVAAKTE